MADDHIEITHDDLDDVPEPPRSARLEITHDDLLDVPDEPARAYPGMPGGPAAFPAPGYTKVAPRTSLSSLLQYLIAGGIGGLVGWAIIEPFTNDRQGPLPVWIAVQQAALFFGIISACVSAALGAAEGLTSRVWQKALAAAGLGAVIGFPGGACAGVLGQLVFGILTGANLVPDLPTRIIARAVSWGLACLAAGIAQGALLRSSRKAIYGLLGGGLGGTIGGMLFDPISMISDVGTASRAVAIIFVGACAGLAIGLVEEFRKQGWLLITSGLLRGKQFILYKDDTLLGGSPKCDIVLPKDPGVAPQHALIRAESRHYLLQDLSGTPTVLVNGRPVRSQGLQDGDTVQIGATTLLFRTSAVATGYPQPPYPPPT